MVSAGFAEAGPAGAAAQARADPPGARRRDARGRPELPRASPTPTRRYGSTRRWRRALPAPGRVGFFSQSGALGVALLAEADRRGLGLSSFVSAGNRADVSGNDLLQYWRDDPGTDVILLYLESFGNPRKFARLARGIGRDKPIVAVASPARPPGSTERGPDPAAVARAVRPLRRDPRRHRRRAVRRRRAAGPPAAARRPPGRHRRQLARADHAGRDACAANGLRVADGYPRDVGPVAGAHEFGDALAEAAVDPAVDALVVVLAPPLPGQLVADDADFAATIASVALAGDKPVVVTSLVDRVPPRHPGLPVGRGGGPRAGPGRRLRRVAPRSRPASSRRCPVWTSTRAVGGDATPGELLAAYGIRLVPDALVDSAPAAVAAATRLGLPVALKAAGPSLRHRIDLGAVRLDLRDERRGPGRLRGTRRARSARRSWCSRWSRPACPA